MPRKDWGFLTSYKETLKTWRNTIRSHRDEIGQGRCWMDDWLVYEVVLNITTPELPALEKCLELCEQYYDCRRTLEGDADGNIARQVKTENPDTDLDSMTETEIQCQQEIIRKAVIVHYKIGDGKRTAEDDRQLYAATLPEKTLANQVLPSKHEFVEVGCQKHIQHCLKR